MKKTILIVEDDADMQYLYKKILAKEYNLRIVSNTEAAKKILGKDKIHLMILDIILPKQTGDIFLTYLKQKPEFKDLKVLCITVLGDVTKQLKFIDPNVRCLAKPFKDEILEKEIKEMLE